MAAKTTTSIKLDDALKARLQRLAASRRRTPHWLMCEAIEQYVAREEKGEANARSAQPDAHDPDAVAKARIEEAYAWLAQLEAKGTHVNRPPPPRKWR